MTPKWAWPGSRDPISKFWDPLITFERIELSTSNLVLTEDGPLRHVDRKMTPKWAWLGSRDPISKYWDPIITLERIELFASHTHTHVRLLDERLTDRNLNNDTARPNV